MASASEYQVVTPERVSLQYDIAGIGSRGAAILVDFAVQGVISLVLYMALLGVLLAMALIGGLAGGRGGITPTGGFFIVLALFVFALFALTLGYHMLFEIIWNGQTPGKRATGIRVIRENGYPIRPVDAVIRNVVRIVDYLPFAYAVGVFTMLFNDRARRLGDFAAGTIVVREGPRSAIGFPPSSADIDAVRPTTLQPDDATLVRDFLTRRPSLTPEARAALAARLAHALNHRYNLAAAADEDPESLLSKVV
jgi:uncharacterized RDD family membrane protein YckC